MTEQDEDEVTPGGSTVYRYDETQPAEPGEAAQADFDAIDAHIARHLGESESVFHELVSDRVHMDVILVPPAGDRDYRVLVTSGMSALPMAVPEEHPCPEEVRHAELVIALPPDWKLDQESLEDENNYWPVRLLKFLGRFPHEFGTWLSDGHTLPNFDPPEPYAKGTKMNGAILGEPFNLPEDFHRLELEDGRVIRFFAVFPLYGDEMDYKLEEGADALLACLAGAGVSELLDPKRPSVLKKKGWWPF